MTRRWLLLGALASTITGSAAAQRPGTTAGGRAARPAVPATSDFRIGEIRVSSYNVGHALTDSTGTPIPAPPSPLDGFGASGAGPDWVLGFDSIHPSATPLLVLVEVIFTGSSTDAAGSDRSNLVLTATASSMAGPATKVTLPSPEAIWLRQIMATAPREGDGSGERTPRDRTWLPFIYYVSTHCSRYEFTAAIRVGLGGPVVMRQSADFSSMRFCH